MPCLQILTHANVGLYGVYITPTGRKITKCDVKAVEDGLFHVDDVGMSAYLKRSLIPRPLSSLRDVLAYNLRVSRLARGLSQEQLGLPHNLTGLSSVRSSVRGSISRWTIWTNWRAHWHWMPMNCCIHHSAPGRHANWSGLASKTPSTWRLTA